MGEGGGGPPAAGQTTAAAAAAKATAANVRFRHIHREEEESCQKQEGTAVGLLGVKNAGP